MQRAIIGLSLAAILVGVISLGIAQNASEHQSMQGMPGMSMPAATASDETPGVFCPTMKTGQLCSHGTSDLLKLTGADRDKWIAAVRRYDMAVDAATVQLQQDAKNLLTPEQSAEVERWFAKGLNPEINKILLSKSCQNSK